MHMISKKDLSKAEMDTLTKSCSPTMEITANGEVQTQEEAIVYVKELDIFLTMKVLENTPAVISFGKLCDENGYSYEWINGQKPHFIKKEFGFFVTQRTSFPLWFQTCKVRFLDLHQLHGHLSNRRVIFFHHLLLPQKVVVQDLTTQLIQTYPCKNKTSQETQRSLQKFLEPERKPKVIYTDNFLEFGKFVKISPGIIARHDSLPVAGEVMHDFWSMSGSITFRHHVEPRVKVCSPREESFLVPFKYMKRIDDNWNIDGSRDLSDPWTGFHTIYFTR